MGVLGEGRVRWAPAVLPGCVALLTLVLILTLAATPLAAEAQAAGSPGQIAGTVTEFTESPEEVIYLQNIEVLAYSYQGEGSKPPAGYAKTNEKGEYTIAGLAAGSYEVEFSPTLESGLNFVTQYYENTSWRAKAKPVEVKEGETADKIDAAMKVGGEVSGTVTDAWTHTPVSRVYVVALALGGGFAGVTETNAGGEYTIPGLASREYKIEFVAPTYIVQYYNDQSVLTGANPVTVQQGNTTSAIDATLVRREPVNTVAPAVSGTPAVGQTLTCSTGAWTGDPTPTYTYAWLRNGTAIPGASAGAYGVQSADLGSELSCQVTATNENGGNNAVSNTLTLPPAPPPPPAPIVEVLATTIHASGGSVRVPISCAQATCTGTIELTGRITIRHRHRHGGTRIRRETVVFGAGVYALSADHSAMIAIHLSRTALRVLAGARHHHLPVTVQVSVTGGTTSQSRVVLSEPARKPRRHRHR